MEMDLQELKENMALVVAEVAAADHRVVWSLAYGGTTTALGPVVVVVAKEGKADWVPPVALVVVALLVFTFSITEATQK